MRLRSRFASALLALLAVALLPGAARIGTAQQTPFEVIRVDELSAVLRKGTPAQVIDVRSRQEFLTRHIKGAISIPLDTIEMRAGEVSRQGLVVLY